MNDFTLLYRWILLMRCWDEAVTEKVVAGIYLYEAQQTDSQPTRLPAEPPSQQLTILEIARNKEAKLITWLFVNILINLISCDLLIARLLSPILTRSFQLPLHLTGENISSESLLGSMTIWQLLNLESLLRCPVTIRRLRNRYWASQTVIGHLHNLVQIILPEHNEYDSMRL